MKIAFTIAAFRTGSPELEVYRKMGEPEKHVTRVKAEPLGMTVRGPDPATVDAYPRVIDGY